MFNKTINFNKCFKPVLIAYIAIIVIGIVLTLVLGVKFDINFIGGTRISYSYTGDIDTNSVQSTVKSVVDTPVTVTQSTSLAGDTKTVTLNFSGKSSISAENQQTLTETMTKTYPDNAIALYDSTSVSPTVASAFLIKSLAAILIAAALVTVYVGIRFRKIGGVSAAITAFVALILDVLVAFISCVVFGLQIDSNFMAVILTILGYSLNDTIVIYDRIRENRRLDPAAELGELVSNSVNQVKRRTILTTITTILAILTIVVISELYGLTSLRSFAIPIVFGMLSGCISSLFISSPLWVIWKNRRNNKAKQ